jgi:cytochrome c oxidase assembly protein subunit 15
MILKKEYSDVIRYWLYLLLFLLIVIIVVGGLTRLTNSGLSITKWEVISGIFPPFNNKDWHESFDLYKKIPQYYLVNKNISLAEFKIIYYWEYFHRLLGRLFGLIFLIPFIFFIIKKIFSKEYNLKLFLLFCLILLQGIIGWYMVKSGLVENITVSHFRLAIHLNLALILFSSIYWYLLNFVNFSNKYFFNFSNKNNFIKIFVLIIFLQITLGAFVSGLDAGKIYQTWPLMNNNYLPDDTDFKTITLSNIFYNHSLIQFLHRNTAYIIFVYSVLILVNVFYDKKKYLYMPLFFLLFMVFVQISLGIMTLISGLNIMYASMHQISTIFLLVSSINFYHKSIIQ